MMLSVIIPVLNEADNLRRLLPTLKGAANSHEIIVVDGGSEDGSATVATALGARVLHSARGRGVQLRAGAEAASGDVFFFLHADSVFNRRGLDALDSALKGNQAALGGNFRIVFEGERQFCADLTRFYAWMRRHGNYYGDSGIFIRRDAYETIGGIRPIPLMEDYDLVRRMERAGKTLCIDAPPIITSSRRFEGRTWPNIIWGWIKLHALFALKVPPRHLAVMYERLR